jgi:hypothetical protein
LLLRCGTPRESLSVRQVTEIGHVSIDAARLRVSQASTASRAPCPTSMRTAESLVPTIPNCTRAGPRTPNERKRFACFWDRVLCMVNATREIEGLRIDAESTPRSRLAASPLSVGVRWRRLRRARTQVRSDVTRRHQFYRGRWIRALGRPCTGVAERWQPW